MIETIVAAGIAFASTNVDDIFILITLFTQVSSSLTTNDIYKGQFLGIGALIVLSLAGSLIGMVIPKEYIGLLGVFPIYLGIKKIYAAIAKRNEDDDGAEIDNINDRKNIFAILIRVQIISVAAITVANGGDNIGIYIPFFTPLSIEELLLTIVIFFMLTYGWLSLAYYLVSHPLLAESLKKYQPVVFPIILIALGTYILIKNYTYTLFIVE